MPDLRILAMDRGAHFCLERIRAELAHASQSIARVARVVDRIGPIGTGEALARQRIAMRRREPAAGLTLVY